MAPQGCPPPSSDTNFPILAISILGILTTAILLLSYYVFVIRCCLNGHHHHHRRRHHDIIRRLSLSRRWWSSRSIGNPDGLSFSAIYSSTLIERGLDESTIRAIPTLRFRKREQQTSTQSSCNECAVCLNEFRDEENIRLLPNCLHLFHIDCVDTWLQTHANCPLCRTEVTTPVMQLDHELGGSVAIDVRDEGSGGGDQMILNPVTVCRTERKLRKLISMGDECIDVRGKDDQFDVQPMRRSLSMDSSSDQKLYMAVQDILRQNPRFRELGNGEGSSSGSIRTRRSLFFTFGGHCRSSKSALLPNQYHQQ